MERAFDVFFSPAFNRRGVPSPGQSIAPRPLGVPAGRIGPVPLESASGPPVGVTNFGMYSAQAPGAGHELGPLSSREMLSLRRGARRFRRRTATLPGRRFVRSRRGEVDFPETLRRRYRVGRRGDRALSAHAPEATDRPGGVVGRKRVDARARRPALRARLRPRTSLPLLPRIRLQHPGRGDHRGDPASWVPSGHLDRGDAHCSSRGRHADRAVSSTVHRPISDGGRRPGHGGRGERWVGPGRVGGGRGRASADPPSGSPGGLGQPLCPRSGVPPETAGLVAALPYTDLLLGPEDFQSPYPLPPIDWKASRVPAPA